MHITLTRYETSDQGTFGTLICDEHTFVTAELPWRDNKRQVSCIPASIYTCKPYSSPRFPNVYEVTNVPGRSAILIHAGNYAGDASKGYLSDIQGCILIGLGEKKTRGQKMITSSRIALDRLRSIIGKQTFTLTITDDTGAAG